ncbi:recombinase family protein [Brevibacillus formosus]|uniref:recombinase family protein n=1 Tax=Brevibacillus formosus TaxID=54913 RepID=UPI003F19679D
MAIDALREMKNKGVYIDFLDSGKSSENESDEVFIQMLISFAEQESRDKSLKVRFGQKESSMNGVIFTNNTIYGYNYLQKTNELEIIPDEADVIKTIFELYCEGVGIRQIIGILDERGIRTRDGNSFAKSTISKILGNEKYCGTLIRNRLSTGDFLSKLSSHKIKPKEEWVVHENRIPAIVSKEIFEKVQKIRDGKVHTKLQRGVNKGSSEYAGYIRCAQCGNSYTKNIDKGRAFYNCSLKKSKGTVNCDNPNLSLSELEKIIEILQHGGLYETFLFKKNENINELIELKRKHVSRIDQQQNDKVTGLQNELQVKLEQKNRLAILFVEGKFDKDELDSMRLNIDQQIASLKEQIDELSKSNQEIMTEAKEIDVHIEQLRNLDIKKFHSKNEVLSQIKAITVEKSEESSKKAKANIEFKIIELVNRITEKHLKTNQQEKEVQTLDLIYNEGTRLVNR